MDADARTVQSSAVRLARAVTTLQRGEALSWLHGAAAELLTGTETKDEEQIVMRRNGVPIVFVPIGDVIFYYVGSDDVDEMQCTFGS